MLKTKFYHKGEYKQWIFYYGNKKIKSSCSCPDFQFRRMGREKKNPQKVIQIGECKHLKQIENDRLEIRKQIKAT